MKKLLFLLPLLAIISCTNSNNPYKAKFNETEGCLECDIVESADGLVQKTGAGLSLFTRGIALAAAAEPVVQREIFRMPYSSFLFAIKNLPNTHLGRVN